MIEKVENIEQLMTDLRNAMDETEVAEVLKRYGLELSVEEMLALVPAEGELSEDDLDDVAGGCKCQGILKRAVTNFLSWVSKRITGRGIYCFDCGE